MQILEWYNRESKTFHYVFSGETIEKFFYYRIPVRKQFSPKRERSYAANFSQEKQTETFCGCIEYLCHSSYFFSKILSR